MFVRDILAAKPSGPIYAVSRDASVSTAAELLSGKRIGAVIVREVDGPLDGILSERDIVREIGRRGVGCMSDCVADLMTSNVKSCSSTDTTQAVMQMMTEGRFRHMPVIDEGALVGVVSIGDVVAARIKEVQFENDSMADLIAGNI